MGEIKIATKNKRHGSNAERIIAEIIGGVRTGDKMKIDVKHPVFDVEVKSFQSIGKIGKAMSQAKRNCSKTKIPCAIIHEKAKEYKDSLVILSLEDALKLSMFQVSHDMIKIYEENNRPGGGLK